jgi:hypothetical protein
MCCPLAPVMAWHVARQRAVHALAVVEGDVPAVARVDVDGDEPARSQREQRCCRREKLGVVAP